MKAEIASLIKFNKQFPLISLIRIKIHYFSFIHKKILLRININYLILIF